MTDMSFSSSTHHAHAHAVVGRGESHDLRATGQAAVAQGAIPDGSKCAGFGERGESGSGLGELVRVGGPKRSSSSCSASRISRVRRRATSISTEPEVPSIPAIFLNLPASKTRAGSSSGATPPHSNVTRTRALAAPTSEQGGGRSGEGGDKHINRCSNRETTTAPLISRRQARSSSISNSNIIVHPSRHSDATLGAQAARAAGTGPIPIPEFNQRQGRSRRPRPRSLYATMATPTPTPLPPDLFFEYASQSDAAAAHSINHVVHRRSMSRTSNIDKRRSLPPDLMPRPSTSGGTGYNRPSPRFQHVSRASTELQRHMDQYNGGVSRPQNDDNTSQAGRTRGLTTMADRSPLSPRSPEISSYGRRRPSGVLSPHTQEPQDANMSGQKPAESASSDSQSVDTVWDELDDLKSRIKKLELTGKLPPTSSAAVSGGSSDRPRTATTAPTTIDSSPKQGRKQEPPTPQVMTPQQPPDTPTTPAGINVTNIHPLLHNALAKAKPLLNANLFRSLEATATDALQLAAMTGSAGPQGTTFSAASIINGVTVSDRHVRRKADNMCRNLTDLCLALCEGKHEAPSVFSSPSTTEPVLQRSPSLRYTRSGLGSASTVRPASRLEARRSSILGAPPSTASDLSPRGSIGDLSNYDQEQSPPQQSPHSYLQAPQRMSRAPNGRLRSRLQSHDDVSGNEDEDHTVRPLSRAMTDAGSFRARPRIVSESRTPGPGQHRMSNSSLRDSIINSRTNEEVYEHNRQSSYGAEPRYSSDMSRQAKRQSQLYNNTPPTVTEEDDNTLRGGDFQSSLQSRRRVTSQQQYSSRRAADAVATQRRSGEGGLQQRRHLAME